MVRWHIFWLELMEADVDAVVAGFITGEVFPLSYSCLQGVVGGSEILRIGTITCGFLQQAAHVVNRGLWRGDAVFEAYVIQACKEVGGFGRGAVRECEGLGSSVVSLEMVLMRFMRKSTGRSASFSVSIAVKLSNSVHGSPTIILFPSEMTSRWQ